MPTILKATRPALSWGAVIGVLAITAWAVLSTNGCQSADDSKPNVTGPEAAAKGPGVRASPNPDPFLPGDGQMLGIRVDGSEYVRTLDGRPIIDPETGKPMVLLDAMGNPVHILYITLADGRKVKVGNTLDPESAIRTARRFTRGK